MKFPGWILRTVPFYILRLCQRQKGILRITNEGEDKLAEDLYRECKKWLK